MATQYWVNDDADVDWSPANNWSGSSGGAGGTGPPANGDDVIFDGGNTDACSIDGSTNDLASLTLAAA